MMLSYFSIWGVLPFPLPLPQYLRDNPQTIISLAYFDFDLYKPTRDCLEAILPYLTKGSILAFDELNAAEFPGKLLPLGM